MYEMICDLTEICFRQAKLIDKLSQILLMHDAWDEGLGKEAESMKEKLEKY